MKQKTKNKLKGGLLAFLMAAGIIKGFAEEKEGIIVLRTDARTDVTILHIATNGQKIPNYTGYFGYRDSSAKAGSFTNSLLQKGVPVRFDDKNANHNGNLPELSAEDFISIDDMYMIDLYSGNPQDYIISAEAKARDLAAQAEQARNGALHAAVTDRARGE
ncbi:hypothetical protein LQZ19_14805 [Treponema primitia]|uniref:hypothetical protein n=1 Tax=Treponema primitia TaxID=88058 RepID=UPI00397EE955